jgi:hypothetical protein
VLLHTTQAKHPLITNHHRQILLQIFRILDNYTILAYITSLCSPLLYNFAFMSQLELFFLFI